MVRSRWRVLVTALLTVVGTVALSPGRAAHADVPPINDITYVIESETGGNCFYSEKPRQLKFDLHGCNASLRQAWRLWPALNYPGFTVYQVISRNTGECLLAPGGGAVGVGPCKSSNGSFPDTELWTMRGGSTGTFQLISRTGAGCLRVKGSDIGTDPCDTPGTTSYWHLVPADDNVHVRSVYSGKCLEVTGDVANDGGGAGGRVVVQRTCDGSVRTQRFSLGRELGNFSLCARDSGNRQACLGHGGGYRGGDRLTASDRFTRGSQVKWLLTTSDYSSFHITVAENPSLAIDLSITGGGHLENKKIQFYAASSGKSNQRWEFVKL